MDIVIVGGGGHAVSLCEALKSTNICGYTDSVPNPLLPGWLGSDEIIDNDTQQYLLGIGIDSDGRTKKRQKAAAALKCNPAPAAISPSAKIAPSATLGNGTVVMQQAIVNAHTSMGKHCVANTGAIVEHNCTIADHVFIGPGAIICGGVTIGYGVTVGAGAVVKNCVNICQDVVIGCGAVVVKDINESGTYIGSPARKI